MAPVTKVETQQRAATSESLHSAEKQGLPSESQQHPVPLDCCCPQDQRVSAPVLSFPARMELTRSKCPRPKPGLGARDRAGTHPGLHTAAPSRDVLTPAPALPARPSQASRCAQR